MDKTIIAYAPNRELKKNEESDINSIFKRLGYVPITSDSYCFFNENKPSEADSTQAIQYITWYLSWFNKSIKTLNIYRFESIISADFIVDYAKSNA